jgi:hypothetical protein
MNLFDGDQRILIDSKGPSQQASIALDIMQLVQGVCAQIQ